ncbi:PadR family transcriptional regulator [Hoeflea sp. TYP-13]|uniref:PadR family transcriptional regulator n=1 Tax=Hoeflea sp. TYP-13 TaxID=3230023 RepID=UPI0034C5DA24
MKSELTNAEYAILGLLMERPCHGYDLDRLIEERGMREWTELAFSSIYFLLGKLEKNGLAESRIDPQKKTRKIYHPTERARSVFRNATVRALADPHPLYPAILLGLANWASLDRKTALAALRRRDDTLAEISARIAAKAKGAPQFLPHINALFDYSTSQLQAERNWLQRTLKLLGDGDGKD